MVDRAKNARGPGPEDKVIGARVRARRLALGLSQKHVAAALGVTFQQFQKYENGTNRISAMGIYRLSEALNLPLGDVYEGLTTAIAATGGANDDQPVGGDGALAARHSAHLQRDIDTLLSIFTRLTQTQRSEVIAKAFEFVD